MAERIDDLYYSGYKIMQDTDGFCFGIDAVLLADFSANYASQHTLDLCAGNGIIALLLAAKTHTPQFSCVEVQQKPYELSQKSVALNHLEDRIHLYHMDLRELKKTWQPNRFSLVTCNPPYTKLGAGLINPSDQKAAARHEVFGSLSDIIQTAAYLLKPQGTLTMVHKSQRLPDILCEMRSAHLEPKTIQFVHKDAQSPANLVLIAARKNGGCETTILPPFIMYDQNHALTKRAQSLYH